MQKQVPSIGKILTMVIFVLSCLGLLLFLWATFGGPVPLKPHGYRVKVSFPAADLLTKEADVRISGVTVGKVKQVALVENEAQATVEIDEEFAPVPADTRAILRQKTIVGEAYVELTPGTADSATVEDGGELDGSQVADNVTFDEFLQTFDSKTRTAVKSWLQQMAVAVDDRGWDLNSAFGSLAPFSANFNELLTILERDQEALKLLVRNGSGTFDALTRNGDDLRGLIENANAVFTATGERNQALADGIAQLPEFLEQSQLTLVRTREFARETNPLIDDLKPVAKELKPVLKSTEEIAPGFKRFMAGLDPLFDASVDGVPGINKFLNATGPLLEQLYPFLLQLNPTLAWISQYDRELAASIANLAAVTNGEEGTGDARLKTLRVLTPMNPESFAGYPSRLPTNRNNDYPAAGAYDLLGNPAIQVFDTANCSSDPLPTVGATDPPELKELMDELIFGLGSGAAPPCSQQPNSNFQGQSRTFAHVQAEANDLD